MLKQFFMAYIIHYRLPPPQGGHEDIQCHLERLVQVCVCDLGSIAYLFIPFFVTNFIFFRFRIHRSFSGIYPHLHKRASKSSAVDSPLSSGGMPFLRSILTLPFTRHSTCAWNERKQGTREISLSSRPGCRLPIVMKYIEGIQQPILEFRSQYPQLTLIKLA